MADRSMTSEELFESHVAEGMTPRAAAELVDAQWPVRLNIYRSGGRHSYSTEPAEWVRPHGCREIQHLQELVAWLEHELAAVTAELEDLRGEE